MSFAFFKYAIGRPLPIATVNKMMLKSNKNAVKGETPSSIIKQTVEEVGTFAVISARS